MKTEKYIWKNIVVGGGGFVPGIIFHPVKKGLVYLRTDMGGAYRRDSSSKIWTCITDMFGKDEADYNGVLSMAVDPYNADTVYMMNGKYTHKEAPGGAFHASNDRGRTWRRTLLPFKVGGNEKGRGCGERLSVNPENTLQILMGSTTDGMWRSEDKGKCWKRVDSFPAKNINFVTHCAFGSYTIIFAAAADTAGKSLYESLDNGKTWMVIPGQPKGLMAMRCDFFGNMMYVTFSDSSGPYGIQRGAFWKYDIIAEEWFDLKPPAGIGGFSGVSIDRHDPKRIIVSTLNRFKPHDEIYMTEDAGKTWKPLMKISTWDKSYAGYTKTMTPHWISDIKIDPFNGKRAIFTTGYGIWTSTQLSSKKASWSFDNKGLEETVPMQIISPGRGAHLLSAMGDIDGFKHDSFVKSPQGRFNPWAGTTLAISYAENKPLKIVKAYNARPPYGAYSTDGGVTWVNFKSSPAGAKQGGLRSIAVSCDGRSIVWAPKEADISFSHDNGDTWTKCKGLNRHGLWPFADKAEPEKFYIYDGVKGCLFMSKDKGRSFFIAVKGLPREKKYPGGDGMSEYSASATPGREQDIWIASGRGGLFHYWNNRTDKISGISAAFRIGFGMAKKKNGYPAIYLWGAENNVTGFFRSDNCGESWVRINDNTVQYGWIHDIIGDQRVYGRCYLGVEGRGALCGKIYHRSRIK
jgi:photosystem II stability/assembly factor-like uncharacterized protein